MFFYNPSQRTSLWERPEDLQNRPDVDKMIQNPPDAATGLFQNMLCLIACVLNKKADGHIMMFLNTFIW